jgi:hypothetical protein
VAQIDAEVLLALTKFVVGFYVGGVILMLAYLLLFWLAVRGPIVATLSKLSNPNMLAFMTNNPIVALPATLDTLEKDYGVDPSGAGPGDPLRHLRQPARRGVPAVLPDRVPGADLRHRPGLPGLRRHRDRLHHRRRHRGRRRGGADPHRGADPRRRGHPDVPGLVVLATTDNIIGPVRTVLTLQANITLTVMTARRGQEMPEEPAHEGAPRPSEAT